MKQSLEQAGQLASVALRAVRRDLNRLPAGTAGLVVTALEALKEAGVAEAPMAAAPVTPPPPPAPTTAEIMKAAQALPTIAPVPTLQEVMDAGYEEEVAKQIVAEEQARFNRETEAAKQ